MRVHGYLIPPPTKSDQYNRAVIPTLDMIEPSWSFYPDGARLAREHGMKADAKLIAYKTLSVTVDTDRSVIGAGPHPEESFLHHKNGSLYKPQETGYNNPGGVAFLNPASPYVLDAARAEQDALCQLGFHGYRYDEAVVGWTDGLDVNWDDCAEFKTRSQYAYKMGRLCNMLRDRSGFIQLPSVAQFQRFDHEELFVQCRGLSSENFPTGIGIYVDWLKEGSDEMSVRYSIPRNRIYDHDGNNAHVGSSYPDTQRNIVGAARLLEWLDDRYEYTCMFFAKFPMGLGALSSLAESVGRHQIYWNLDFYRHPHTGQLPPWVS